MDKWVDGQICILRDINYKQLHFFRRKALPFECWQAPLRGHSSDSGDNWQQALNMLSCMGEADEMLGTVLGI